MSFSSSLELHNVTKVFHDFTAVSRLSLKVTPGEKIAILGSNGAGKSTLLKIVAGILHKDEGALLWDGSEYRFYSEDLKRSIAYLPDDPPLYDLLNAREYLEYVAALWKVPLEASAKPIQKLMQDYQMDHAAHIWSRDFSRGMKQKLGLMSVLFRKPSILLLDEPFNALDTDAVTTTIGYLNNKSWVNTMLIVSHDLDLLEKVADRAIILEKGAVIAELSTCVNLKARYEEAKLSIQK